MGRGHGEKQKQFTIKNGKNGGGLSRS